MNICFALPRAAAGAWLHTTEILLLLFGAVLVIGLIGEHKVITNDKWKPREHLFSMLVLIGVLGELLADGGIFAFSDRLQRISDSEVAQANKVAAYANREAGFANERARTLESTNLALALRIEELRRKNDVLEGRLQPRAFRFLGGISRFVGALDGKPNADVELLYQPGDSESCALGKEISFGLRVSGWRVFAVRPLNDADIPPARRSEMPDESLVVRATGRHGGWAIIANKVPQNLNWSSLRTNLNPSSTFSRAMEKCGFDTGPTFEDSRVAENTMKVVIGPKNEAQWP